MSKKWAMLIIVIMVKVSMIEGKCDGFLCTGDDICAQYEGSLSCLDIEQCGDGVGFCGTEIQRLCSLFTCSDVSDCPDVPRISCASKGSCGDGLGYCAVVA
ncbi:hypothetical protein SUGI_0820330 [Cryptomeria japonica]|nr:hypothetical protein SUGI_0820330 [Cryptomeria japonica]